jgi:hypothetical protein
MTRKEEILQLVRSLPDDVTTKDIVAALRFYDAVNQGLEEADAGRLITHEEARKRLAKWLKDKKQASPHS